MKIEIDKDEADKLIKKLLSEHFDEMVIDSFHYNEWNGLTIEGQTRATLERPRGVPSLPFGEDQ
jgi:hypothetical protein